jgi:hypothetical protein
MLLIQSEEKWFYLVRTIYPSIQLNMNIIKGSMWTICALSIFQLLSDDYISYVFFIFFIGLGIGAIRVITIPYVMEMV